MQLLIDELLYFSVHSLKAASDLPWCTNCKNEYVQNKEQITNKRSSQGTHLFYLGNKRIDSEILSNALWFSAINTLSVEENQALICADKSIILEAPYRMSCLLYSYQLFLLFTRFWIFGDTFVECHHCCHLHLHHSPILIIFTFAWWCEI